MNDPANLSPIPMAGLLTALLMTLVVAGTEIYPSPPSQLYTETNCIPFDDTTEVRSIYSGYVAVFRQSHIPFRQ